MTNAIDISPALRADLERKRVDIDLTLELLGLVNGRGSSGPDPVRASGVPSVERVARFDARSRGTVVDLSAANGEFAALVPAAVASDRLGRLGLSVPATVPVSGGMARFDRATLADLGRALFGRTAFGVLNGGSATSYADRKKNESLDRAAFDALADVFDRFSPLCADRPKGLAPAFVNPDGTPGPSFMELKVRALLLAAGDGGEATEAARPALPLFQMTSDATDGALADAYARFVESPFLRGLAGGRRPVVDPSLVARQPLVAAFTHSKDGFPRRVFDRAWGKPDSGLALPGGHGQSFRVLSKIYERLLADGYRFAYLGNVDNLGSLPDPVELACLALSGTDAGFDFALRTPVDVKGGVLVTLADGGATVADIGQAVSFDDVLRLEAAGSRLLFNCATGLFDLTRLVPRLRAIETALPPRVSDQDKDAGRYSQAELSTWEVIGLLESFVGFAVDKGSRFIAAKTLMETLLSSVDADRLPAAVDPGVAATARDLGAGLARLLAGPYGLVLRDGRWLPKESV